MTLTLIFDSMNYQVQAT